jgi:hypothetical protein
MKPARKDPWETNGCNSTHCDIRDIQSSRGCKNHAYTTIHNQTTWVHMRAAYVAIVGPEDATLNLTYGSGMKVPFKIGHSPGRGRGVFAAEDIRKGTLVWYGENTAAFTSGVQFRKFLASLPDVFVCELIHWCYTSQDENKMPSIECDLDEGSLFNTIDNGAEYTIGCSRSMVENYPRDCLDAAYALRDITAGEEFITNYDEFTAEIWYHFGL